MTKKRVWLIVTVISLILAGALIRGILKESSGIIPKPDTGNKFQVDSEELIGLAMKVPGTDPNGYWELNCAKMLNVKRFGTLTAITGRYYIADKPVYHLAAESGFVYWGSSILKLQGNVKLSMNDGTELSAEEIVWDPKKNQIKAQRNVSLTTRSLVVKTDRITAWLGLRKAVLQGMTELLYKESRGVE